MPETGDGAQGLAKKSTPVSCPFSHEGRRGSLGVLMPETGDGTQGLPEKPTLSRMPWSPGSGAPLCGTQGAAAYTGACGSARSKGRPRPLEAAHPCAARGEQRRIPMPVVLPDQKDALVPWKRRIPVQRAGSSGVYRCLWFRQIKEDSGRDADATRLQSATPRSTVACSIAQISNGDRETMLLLVVHPVAPHYSAMKEGKSTVDVRIGC